MPTFRTTLPPEGKHMGFSLKRTPATSGLQATVTAEDLLVCDTHFWHGRTTPCERTVNDEGGTIDDSPCQACREKIPFRTHCYVSAFDAKKQEHFIFECTTHAAKPLAEYRDTVGTIRGCIFRATRPKGTPNGQVAIETATADLKKGHLPPAPSVMLALAVIWRIPMPGLQIAHEKTDENLGADSYAVRRPHVRMKNDRLKTMREQEDNASEPLTMAEILAGNGHAKTEKATA